jgi:aminopeptidase N
MTTHDRLFEARCQGREPVPSGDVPERHAPDRTVEVTHVALDVAVDLEDRSIRGVARHDLRVLPPLARAIVLDAVALEIDGVSADGRPVAFVHDGERLTILPEPPWRRDERHRIEVTYRGRPERGLHFIAPDADRPERPLQAWTQGQDEDARFWFPCVDHPSQRPTSEISVVVPHGLEAVSNGRLAARTDVPDGSRFHWVQDVPHATYLVSLVVGRFAVVEDRAGPTALRYLVPKGMEAHVPRTFGRTPRMLSLFERAFGHPYPYAKYDQVVVSDFTSGGMENTTATTLHESVLLDETVEGAVDRDDLIAHELAHHWFGNLLTCRDWAHAWLNEGLATYAEVLWFEEGDSAARAAAHVTGLARRYFDEARREYRRPIVTHRFDAPIDIFDRHLYEKAACVLHLLRGELGDETFFRGLRTYVRAHARGLVETHDLRRSFETESGRNLVPFFDQWIFRSGHPEIEVEHAWDAATRRLSLSVRQVREDASGAPWRFRLPCRVFLPDGGTRAVDRELAVTEREHRFTWELPREPAGVRVGAASLPLVLVRFARPDAWLAHQLAADDDVTGRIEAACELGRSGSAAAVLALAARLRRESTWMGQVEIARALGDARGAAARLALVSGLDLPDPRARAAVATALGSFREDGDAAVGLADLLARERHPIVRAAAFRAIGATRTASARALLTAGLGERSWCDVVGRACVAGLGALKDPALVPVITPALARREHEQRRVAAVGALRETASVMEVRTAVRERVESLLGDPDYHVARAAVEALEALGDKASIPPLERLASRRHLDPRLRRVAKGAIGAISGDRLARLPGEVLERLERVEREVRDLRDRAAAVEPASRPENTPPAARIASRERKMPRGRRKQRP